MGQCLGWIWENTWLQTLICKCPALRLNASEYTDVTIQEILIVIFQMLILHLWDASIS
jgi:hypothetical protein